MQRFLDACRYLTVLPLPAPAGRAHDLARAAAWFPVVGLGLGGVLALAAVGLALVVPPPVSAVLVVALWVGLTGGLHLDGLADAADGLGGGLTRERALAIMRDARIGAFGVTAVALVLAAKVAVLTTLPAEWLWRACVMAPVCGRLSPLLLARLCAPARPDGAGHDFAPGVRGAALGAASAVTALSALVVLGPWGWLPLAATGGGAWLFAAYLRRRLGGATGDCLGALVELSEAATLVLVSALAVARER